MQSCVQQRREGRAGQVWTGVNLFPFRCCFCCLSNCSLLLLLLLLAALAGLGRRPKDDGVLLSGQVQSLEAKGRWRPSVAARAYLISAELDHIQTGLAGYLSDSAEVHSERPRPSFAVRIMKLLLLLLLPPPRVNALSPLRGWAFAFCASSVDRLCRVSFATRAPQQHSGPDKGVTLFPLLLCCLIPAKSPPRFLVFASVCFPVSLPLFGGGRQRTAGRR